MNPSNLNARETRKHPLEHETVFPPSVPSPLPPPTGSPFTPDHVDHALQTAAATPDLGAPDAAQLAEDVRRLRHAVAQLLSRATGEDISYFENAVVNDARLCAVADNIWHRRPWTS
jgi:hypothetical protein